MGDFTSSLFHGDAPKYAQGPPFTEAKDAEGRHRVCHACGSEQTQCIHFDYAGSNIGYWVEEEHLCLDCGKFTVYESDYDS